MATFWRNVATSQGLIDRRTRDHDCNLAHLAKKPQSASGRLRTGEQVPLMAVAFIRKSAQLFSLEGIHRGSTCQ